MEDVFENIHGGSFVGRGKVCMIADISRESSESKPGHSLDHGKNIRKSKKSTRELILIINTFIKKVYA